MSDFGAIDDEEEIGYEYRSQSNVRYAHSEVHMQEEIMKEVDVGDRGETFVGTTFSCRTETIKDVIEVLSCLYVNMKKDNICEVEGSPEGLAFVVEGSAKSTQVRATLKNELFDNYHADGSGIRLSLNLTQLLDCLFLFGSSSDTTILTMTYCSDDGIFKLMLEDSGILTTCDIVTLVVDDASDRHDLFVSYHDNQEEASCVVKSEFLREIFQDINEVAGATAVKIALYKKEMVISTMGSGDSVCDMAIPSTSEAFISFQCARSKGVSWIYPLASIQLGTKALSVASETCLQVNSEGVMMIQHQILSKQGKSDTFVDFLAFAEADDTSAM
jgi:hypothetical protein